MIDKWMYKIFSGIDDAFCWLDNNIVSINKKWRKIKMWKFIKKLWKKYVNWLWS